MRLIYPSTHPSPLPPSKPPCLSQSLSFMFSQSSLPSVSPTLFSPVVSPSRGGDVAIYVFDLNLPSLPTPLKKNSVLVSVSVSMDLSTVFLSINSPDSSLLSHSVPPILFLPYWSFQLYTS